MQQRRARTMASKGPMRRQAWVWECADCGAARTNRNKYYAKLGRAEHNTRTGCVNGSERPLMPGERRVLRMGSRSTPRRASMTANPLRVPAKRRCHACGRSTHHAPTCRQWRLELATPRLP